MDQGRVSALALVVGVSLGLAGCAGSYNGGGFITSVAGAPAKATFGGTVHVIDVNPDPMIESLAVEMGQFQWNDHGTGMRLHISNVEGPIYGLFYPSLFNPLAVMQAWSGTYTSPQGDGTVEFGLGLQDPEWAQIFDSSLNDGAFLRVTSGPFDGYFNVGLIEGGQIVFRPSN